VKYPHDKIEGIWLINNTTLGVLNDDDLGLWSNAKGMEQNIWIQREQESISIPYTSWIN
jgi:hypothetical protein